MAAEVDILLPLLARTLVTALVVASATMIAERAGAIFGAMLATLPISTGTAYVFLALDHDAGFIARSGFTSFTANIANCLFAYSYVRLAQTHGLVASTLGALVVWVLAAALVQVVPWTTASALVGVWVVVIGCAIAAEPYRRAVIPLARRYWYDLPMRAALAGTLVGAVATGSSFVGPDLTGLFATFPVILLCFMLILGPRIGGLATAAVIANALTGLIGFTSACLTLHLAAEPLGSFPAMALALGAAVACNGVTLTLRLRSAKHPRK